MHTPEKASKESLKVRTGLKAGAVRSTRTSSSFVTGDDTLTIDEDGFIQEPE
jgi:hypothetical protein